MNRKQKIIVSTTGIFLVLLILVGLTYAYFLTRINGNKNDKSISVTTANLRLVYSDGTDGVIGGTNIEPSDTVYTKTFTVKSEGNKNIEYGVYLINVINQLTRKEDVKYTLECTTDGTIKCNGVNETTFPSGISQLITNTIEPGKTHTYTFKFTYKDTGTDQSIDMGKELSAKIQIFGKLPSGEYFPYEEGTLSYNIINNAKNNLNGTEYLETPKTKVAEEVADFEYKGIKKNNTSSDDWLGFPSTYKDYYITYGTGYTIDKNTGKFSLTGVSTCKFSECYSNLSEKYISTSYTTYLSETDTQKESSNLSEILMIKSISVQTSSIGICGTIMTTTTYGIEKVLSKTEDDYGTSYYYRGVVENNYVNFAGMCWRIVRVSGDGSIKLILEDQDNTCTSSNGNTTTTSGLITNFGYTEYAVNTLTATDGTTNSSKLELMNYLKGGTDNDRSMATAFKNFQIETLKNYLSYLKSGDWCLNDKAYATKTDNTTPLTSQEILDKRIKGIAYYYDSYVRLEGKTIKEPTLKCNGTNMMKFGDGTTNMYVGTLTADEVAYAGGSTTGKHAGYYYISGKIPLLSPSYIVVANDGSLSMNYQMVYYVSGDATISSTNLHYISSLYFKPSINLKSGIKITSGDGTKEKPYEIAN
mgnify:CR=1 FL=1